MRKLMNLGTAALVYGVFFASPSVAIDHQGSVKRGNVLNTVYSMISDERLSSRKCGEVKPKNQAPYELCAIAMQSTFGNINFSFFAASPKVVSIFPFKQKSPKGLEIQLKYGSDPCVYRFTYISDGEGSFNDEKSPYRAPPPLVKYEKGKTISNVSNECQNRFLVPVSPGSNRRVLNMSKIREMHRKGLEAIAFTIKVNAPLPQISKKD